MLTHKNIGKICAACVALSMVIALIFMNGEALGIVQAESTNSYAYQMFGELDIQTIDIIVDTDDWNEMLDNASEKEYITCNLIINGEQFSNIAIRTKGNSSLQQVQSNGSDRYSFKIEFDHYDNTTSYYGLDKLCLNNIVQDSTYMKDYLAYDLMNQFGVASPLANYASVSVNGEVFGLYLAVEAIEEGFLQRNYGTDYGTLYKPETSSGNAGGGDAGGDREMPEMTEMPELSAEAGTEMSQMGGQMGGGMQGGMGQMGGQMSGMTGEMPEMGTEMTQGEMPEMTGEMPEMDGETTEMSQMSGQMGGGMQGGQMGDMTQETTGETEVPEIAERQEMSDRTSGGMQGGMGSSTSTSTATLSSAFGYDGDDTDSYSYIFDNYVTDIDTSDMNRLIDSIEQLNEQENLEEVVDVEQLIRYFIVHNFLLNYDSYTGGIMHNYYLYEEDGVMTMLPWDYNLSFVAFQTSYTTEELANFPIDTPVSSGTVESRPMLAWIFSNEEYTEMYHELYAEFIDELFVSGYFEETVLAVEELISDAVEEDPSKFCTFDQFVDGVDALLEFVSYRVESIQGQLAGTIGITAEEQATNTNLISTGDLDVTDTGSESVQKGTGDDQSPTRNQGGGGGQMGGGGGGMMGGMGQMDMTQMREVIDVDGAISQASQTIGLSDTQMLLIGSGLLLVIGLAVAIFYRRKTH